MTETLQRLEGLDWLEGQTVRVIADGLLVGDYTVVGGVVELPHPVTRGWVGLPYRGHVRTLPSDLGMPTGLSRGVKRSVDRVHIESTGIGGEIGFSYFDGLEAQEYQGINAIPTRLNIDELGAAAAPRRQVTDPEMASEGGDIVQIDVKSEPGFPMQLHTIEYWVNANG